MGRLQDHGCWIAPPPAMMYIYMYPGLPCGLFFRSFGPSDFYINVYVPVPNTHARMQYSKAQSPNRSVVSILRILPSMCTYHCPSMYLQHSKAQDTAVWSFPRGCCLHGRISTWDGNGTCGPNSRQLCMGLSSSGPLNHTLKPIICTSHLSERDLIDRLGGCKEVEMQGSSAQKRVYCGPV